MIYNFSRGNINYAGLLSDANSAPVVVDCSGFDVISATITHISGTFSTGSLRLKWANEISGPWNNFATTITLDSSTSASGLVAVVGRYVGIYVQTGQGSDTYVDATINVRRSEIPTAIPI